MPTSPKRLGSALCALLLVAALVVPAVAGARTSVPATGSLYFGKPTAKVVGQTALIGVRCVGVKGSTCSGTITLSAGSATSEAPFTVTSGGNRTVAVPVAAGSGSTVVATAQTAQSSGAYVTSTEVLRLH
jgi:hypothetical protein